MAKKKEAEAPKGSPAWMATFSDLMNLLLCFFVLLFSMSTVSEEKFEMVIASLQSKLSIFEMGSPNVSTDGSMIGGGIYSLPQKQRSDVLKASACASVTALPESPLARISLSIASSASPYTMRSRPWSAARHPFSAKYAMRSASARRRESISPISYPTTSERVRI